MTTTVQQALARTKEAAAKRAAAATDEYRALVQRCAKGADVDPDEVAEFLADAGVDVETFDRDVGTYMQRLEWKAAADKVPAQNKELASVRQKLTDADRRLDEEIAAAREKHTRIVQPLLARDAELDASVKAGERAGRRLSAECPYPERVARVAAAHQRANEIRAQLHARQQRNDSDLATLPRLLAAAQERVRVAVGNVSQLQANFAANPGMRGSLDLAEKEAADANAQLARLQGVENPNDPFPELRAELQEAEAELASATRELSIP